MHVKLIVFAYGCQIHFGHVRYGNRVQIFFPTKFKNLKLGAPRNDAWLLHQREARHAADRHQSAADAAGAGTAD